MIDYVFPMNPDSPVYINETAIEFVNAGHCDAVAIWVDLDLTDSGLRIRGMESGVFKYYAKVTIRYFPERMNIERSSNDNRSDDLLGFNKIIHCRSDFSFGSSDINFHFTIK